MKSPFVEAPDSPPWLALESYGDVVTCSTVYLMPFPGRCRSRADFEKIGEAHHSFPFLFLKVLMTWTKYRFGTQPALLPCMSHAVSRIFSLPVLTSFADTFADQCKVVVLVRMDGPGEAFFSTCRVHVIAAAALLIVMNGV